MAARRRLFLTHAGELAHLLVRAIARDAMTMEFVRGYAEQHDRHKVIANLERLREIESTISREAFLLIAAEVRRLLPRAFGFPRKPRPEDLALCDVFYTEFLQALGRALEWPSADAGVETQTFRRDLEMYATWRERNPDMPGRGASVGDSPFPDRCAILLDPAIMEQARRAAVAFQAHLLRTGTRIFGQLGRPISYRSDPSSRNRQNTKSKARPTAKPKAGAKTRATAKRLSARGKKGHARSAFKKVTSKGLRSRHKSKTHTPVR
jgi:hypothetical protein